MNFELGFFVFPLVMLCAVRSSERQAAAPELQTLVLQTVETVYILELELGATQPFILRHYKCKC